MTPKGFIAIVVATVLLVACSKNETQTNPATSTPPSAQGSTNPAEQPPDYKLICERLTALAPEARKATFGEGCAADYEKMLPSCQNAPVVNTCYANLKEWSNRLACFDSCVRK